MSLLLSLIFCLQQNWRARGQNRFCPEVRCVGGNVAQTMYTHVSKCKNEKIKKCFERFLKFSLQIIMRHVIFKHISMFCVYIQLRIFLYIGYIDTMEHSSVLQKKKILSFVTIWVNLEEIVLGRNMLGTENKNCTTSLIYTDLKKSCTKYNGGRRSCEMGWFHLEIKSFS
jgi:hypothetical protein